MRVLLHANRPRSVTGAERYTVILAKQLRGSQRIREVEVVYPDQDRRPPPGEWDIVHGMDLAPHRAAFAHRLGLPVALTSHVAGWQNVRQGWRTGSRHPLLRIGQLAHHAAMLWRQACAIRDSQAVIPVSRSTLQELLVQAPWARRRFHLVENGVDPDVFPAGTQDEGFGLFVGRLERVKAPDLVVEAFRRLGLPLKVVGAGPLAASLRAAAPPNVSFEGPFTDAGLARLYRGASVCAFPSQSEGYPFVVLEALSSGAPVISTRSFLADPPARDLVRWLPHGVFASTPARRQTREAILADLVAAIKELWGTKTPQNARHRHAVVRANHSWAKATKSIIDVYEGVLQEESRR